MSALQITHALTGEQNEILTPAAQAFLVELHQKFNARRLELLAARHARNAASQAGELPNFLDSTRDIRESKWRVAPIPAALADRRLEITGPVDRKMIIDALNCGANLSMADLEECGSPAPYQIASQSRLPDGGESGKPANTQRWSGHHNFRSLIGSGCIWISTNLKGALRTPGFLFDAFDLSHQWLPALASGPSGGVLSAAAFFERGDDEKAGNDRARRTCTPRQKVENKQAEKPEPPSAEPAHHDSVFESFANAAIRLMTTLGEMVDRYGPKRAGVYAFVGIGVASTIFLTSKDFLRGLFELGVEGFLRLAQIIMTGQGGCALLLLMMLLGVLGAPPGHFRKRPLCRGASTRWRHPNSPSALLAVA